MQLGGGGKRTFASTFYERHTKGKNIGNIYGFPMQQRPWCNDRLKGAILDNAAKANLRSNLLQSAEHREKRVFDLRVSDSPGAMVQQRIEDGSLEKSFSGCATEQGADKNTVQYLGIAADEPERIERHTKPGYALPLVEIGWDEAYCRKWCEENDLLSPIYTTATRGGCWFCHNQGVGQLRLLRANYPDLWELLLKWDSDSPVTFKADGHTVHDFDRRFQLEDEGLILPGEKFRWAMLEEELNLRLF